MTLPFLPVSSSAQEERVARKPILSVTPPALQYQSISQHLVLEDRVLAWLRLRLTRWVAPLRRHSQTSPPDGAAVPKAASRAIGRRRICRARSCTRGLLGASPVRALPSYPDPSFRTAAGPDLSNLPARSQQLAPQVFGVARVDKLQTPRADTLAELARDIVAVQPRGAVLAREQQDRPLCEGRGWWKAEHGAHVALPLRADAQDLRRKLEVAARRVA